MTAASGLSRYRFTAQPRGPTIVRTEGVELVTSDGHRILDAAAGAVVNNIGHGRSEVADAVAAAMREVDYVLPTWATPARLALADTLVERWLPDGFNHVFLAGGGSEANDTALRLARAYHVVRGDERRYKVIGRLPSYHGSTLATLAAGGHAGRRSGYEPMLAEWPKARWNDAAAVGALIESAGPDTVAAFIAEPMIGAAGGALVAPPDYWAEIADVCRRYGVLTIADEVMTGFGRTGRRWGHEHDPWVPDILVSGKGLGGGYVPISLVSAGDHVIDPIADAGRTVMFFTYSGHDASCAGAAAVLRILEEEDLLARAAQSGAQLLEALHAALDAREHVAEVRGRGLMLGVELRGLASADVVTAALARDVWVYPAGSGPSVADAILIAPPFTIENRHIDRIVSAVAGAVDDVVCLPARS